MKKFQILLIIYILFLSYIRVFASDVIFDGGTGKKEDPYLISNPIQFDAIRYHLSSYFKLTNDIDFTFDTQNEKGIFYHKGKGWIPIGGDFNSFIGHLDGGGHQIIGLSIKRPDENFIGLFGEIRSASISNLVLKDVIIEGNSYVGGLVGNVVGSTLDRIVSANGKVMGCGVYVGGLIGANQYGTITNSYNASEVHTESSLAFAASGGLVGLNYNGTIKNGYNIGALINVKYPSNIGGLVGYHFGGSIENTYNTTTNQLVKYAKGTILSSYNVDNGMVLDETKPDDEIGPYSISISYLPISALKDSDVYHWDTNNWIIQEGHLPRIKGLYYKEISFISLDASSIQFKKIGDIKTLHAVINPKDASNQNLLWSSSNEKVVTVEDGTIKMVGYGNATIVVSSQEGVIQATCNISTLIKGDVNEDGKISTTDLSMIRKYLVSSSKEGNIDAMDVNSDGKVTITDLTKIRRYLAGLEVL